jgi:hypothetical protein
MCACKEERHNQNVVRRAQDEMRVVILSTVVIAAAATTTAIRELIETVHKMNYITKEIVFPT